MGPLSNKNALVCGSTQGIGLACAREFAKHGARVTLFARDEAALARLAADLPSESGPHDFLVADFNDPEQVARAVGGKLSGGHAYHILLNNSGGPPAGPLVEADAAQFELAYRRHLLSAHALVQALVPGMKQARYGRIVNVISTSVKAPLPNLGVSNTTRGAVASWAKTLAGELGPFGITVNNVLPGFTQTERLNSIIRNVAQRTGRSEEETAQAMRDEVPARRFGKPEEFAAAAAFLASPQAAYINGINLPVDGGRTTCL